MAGIIPAYAGSTVVGYLERRIGQDHPRIRGEHDAVAIEIDRLTGSSPHTRGAPTACSASTGCEKDHPRIRGEHTLMPPILVWDIGIIPAYAGSTGYHDGTEWG